MTFQQVIILIEIYNISNRSRLYRTGNLNNSYIFPNGIYSYFFYTRETSVLWNNDIRNNYTANYTLKSRHRVSQPTAEFNLLENTDKYSSIQYLFFFILKSLFVFRRQCSLVWCANQICSAYPLHFCNCLPCFCSILSTLSPHVKRDLPSLNLSFTHMSKTCFITFLLPSFLHCQTISPVKLINVFFCTT